MAAYKQMYTKLFNAVTDAIDKLQTAQAETEEIFITDENPDIVVLDNPGYCQESFAL